MKAKIVFITGASSGIGEGCARKFAKEGWNLILNARTVSKLEELKAELEKEYGIQVCVLPFDVRDRKQAAAALEAFVNTADCTRSNGYMTTATFPETFVFTAPGTYEYEVAQRKGGSLNGQGL